MDIIELSGIVASTLVLLTCCMRSMLHMRVLSIISNVAFIGYALYLELLPILVLHILLFFINAFELYRLVGKNLISRIDARIKLKPTY